MKKIIKLITKWGWCALGVCYFPVYFLAWLLHKIVRLMLAFCYLLMLEARKAKDIVRNLFQR